VWEQHPQIEDVVPAPPYDSAGTHTDDYLGAASEDTLKM
jgi:hypothetical protein